MIKKLLLLPLLVSLNSALSKEPSEKKLTALYTHLDPSSLSQHLAFYELYQETPLGKKSLTTFWNLISKADQNPTVDPQTIPQLKELLHSLVCLVHHPIHEKIQIPDEATLNAFEKISSNLPHTKLKGHFIWTEEEYLRLPEDQIDLARGLFITQFRDDKNKIRTYELLIDLMAFQVIARLSNHPTPEEKIQIINHLLFNELGYRFPPHALSTKKIDQYTHLPLVLDSRKGVCLGVSILYLCLSQRLSLPLEIITPPGHIYIRYREGKKIINIETTARGVHIDCEEYLGLNNFKLKTRTLREVIGMAYVNQASVSWQNKEYDKVLETYENATPYLFADPNHQELLGYAHLINGRKDEGERCLKKAIQHHSKEEILPSSIPLDYLAGHVDIESIAQLFVKVEEDRESILQKKIELEKIVQAWPMFKAGRASLASTWIQLNRHKEALEAIKKYLEIEQGDPELLYYASVLSSMRYDYLSAWNYFCRIKEILKDFQHNPKELKDLERTLSDACPMESNGAAK